MTDDEFLGTTSYLTQTGPHEGCDYPLPHQHDAAWWAERRAQAQEDPASVDHD